MFHFVLSFFLLGLTAQNIDIESSSLGWLSVVVEAVTIIPFALKPLLALMSDAVPLCGYHKLPYVAGGPGGQEVRIDRCSTADLW